MLSQKFRFHGHHSLRHVYRRGKVVRAGGITLRFKHNPVRQHSRLSVVVSKKVLKRATQRNRVRRRVYSVAKKYWHQLNGTYDMVITVFDANTLAVPAADLEAQVLQLLQGAKIVGNRGKEPGDRGAS